MWDQQFEEILREYLPFLSADEKLAESTGLRDLGLDSMGIVELLGTLEGAYQVRILDEALTVDTFATPGVLWATLSKMIALAA
jgi:acyl carrier protein